MIHTPSTAVDTPAEPSDLDVAISVAQQLLDSDQVLSLREALRLLLRALGAEVFTEVRENAGQENIAEVRKVSETRRPAAHPEDHTPVGPGCGAPATVSFEGYSPRNGLAHGSLDVIVHACTKHTTKARDEWLGGLMPYRTTPGATSRCGESFDFTTLRGGQ